MVTQSQSMALLTSHQSVDWFTPEHPYIDLVHNVLGEIDLDPASCDFANRWIRAKRFYTIADDGLKQQWKADTIFLNPPYGKSPKIGSNQGAWSDAMACKYIKGEFKEGILLINNTAGYRWFENLYNRHPSCLVHERIRFLNANGVAGGQAKRGQTFIYFGENEERFREVFGTIGRCLPVNDNYRSAK